MYGLIQFLAVVAAVVFGTFYGKYYGYGKFKAFLMCLTNEVLGYSLVFVLTWINNGFKHFGSQNAITMYTSTALICILICKIFKTEFGRCLDFLCLGPQLTYGIGHFACLIPKCCFGFQYTEGSAMYNVANALTGTNQLPNQLWESVSALLVFAIVLIVAIKGKFKSTGKLMALQQILFGVSRFGWEFLRDNKKVITLAPMKDAVSVEFHTAVWGISDLALWAAGVFVAGVVLLIVLNAMDKKKSKEPEKLAAQ